jgi:sugar phosphate isomerase/epimerase
MRQRFTVAVALATGMLLALEATPAQEVASVFRKDNLVAWCIVPFDAKKRGPEERARMLKGLGITRLAYDWRAKDIPTFDEELDALARHSIKLEAFWLPCRSPEPAKEKDVRTILDLLKRRQVKTQLWISLGGGAMPGSAEMTQEQRVAAAARPIHYIATEAAKIGCSVGLYNHGGWFGEPENQVAIIEQLKLKNVGIVYNFHHGHEHVDRFPELFATMKPHLLTLNVNGMRRDGPKILPLGDGDLELGMLKVVSESGYRGPIGILDHRGELDAELSLQQNIDGLQKLLRAMGDEAALKTY